MNGFQVVCNFISKKDPKLRLQVDKLNYKAKNAPRERRRRIETLMMLLALAFPAIAMADGGLFMPLNNNEPVENTAIEVVSAQVSFEGQPVAREVHQWQVTETYQVKNTSDKPVKFTAAIPMDNRCVCYDCKCDPQKDPNCIKTDVEQFAVTMDNQKIKLQKVDMPPPEVDPDVDGADCADFMGFYWTWPIELNAGQTAKVQESYLATTGGINVQNLSLSLAAIQLYQKKAFGQLKIEIIPKIESIPYSEEFQIFPYKASEDAAQGQYDEFAFNTYDAIVYPDGMKSEGKGAARVYKWDLKSFSPDRGITFNFYTPNGYGHKLQQFYAKQFYTNPQALNDDQLRYLRNLPYARWGYEFQTDAMKKAFSKEWWYAPFKGANMKKLLTVEDWDLIKAIKQEETQRKAAAKTQTAP